MPSVKEIIENSMEGFEPQTTIREVLLQNEGKLLTEHVLRKIKAATGRDDIRIRRQYGMTQIEWGKYGSLLMAHAESNVKIDIKAFDKYNTGYFGAAEERNKRRRLCLDQPDQIAELQSCIEQYITLREKIKSMTEYGKGEEPAGLFQVEGGHIQREFNINVEGYK